ncbi:hypothetical protein GCM10011390_23530 [Aureimonas endophytica]|uniref:Sugar lactone lactonase YvrE n=1 Tax=Aureimonas endophytica TaxID=2027858 RepID=A0A916ZLV2_9HYPH|nr:hypothetical protein [Aureimonas endophytica]GGE03851.1 hypothetical protein GCM10011390_23530 [Aureimonas endophytica]
MRALDRVLDLFRGRTVTIPPLDGAFKPNRALDEAALLAELKEPDSLAVTAEGTLLVASGPEVVALGGGAPVPVARFAAPVTALAALPEGGFVAGLADGTIRCEGGPRHGWHLSALGEEAWRCPTAIVAGAPGVIFVAEGSRRHGPGDWAVDLMEGRAGGSVWRVELSGGAPSRLAEGLAWPAGLLLDRDGSLIVSEAWRHRLLRLPATGGAAARPVLERLPGYPGRLAPAAGGGAWLALFAPRNRLVELVLTEPAYRDDMLASIDRRHWIVPALRSGASFLEPLQSGGVVTMGVKKPWAPSRSYGLVARLGSDLQPVASLHSRADGTRHGVTAAVEAGGRLVAAAKGGDAVLDLGPVGDAP